MLTERKNDFLKSDAFIGLVICALVWAGVVLIRHAGILQSTEFTAYDCYLQYQSRISVPENRILLVTISESDIQRVGSWPLNDGLMAQMVENLLVHNPRVIGLDIFRNIEVPPGSEKLRKLFSENIPVISIMKFGDKTSPGVPGPYMAKDAGKVGFGDALIDAGGVVRRGLLFMDDGRESRSSFPLLLTSVYLQKEGIGARPDPENPSLLRFGKTTFVPLERDAGGYVNMDAGGYQFLLDFTSGKAGFPAISLSEVLAGRISDEAVRDKIVLVGATAESLRDYFFIPITRDSEEGQRISGIELHAIVVTQLLRGALDGQRPIEFWSERGELAWIAVWCLLGYVLGLKVHLFRRFALALVFFPAVLAGSTFLMFSGGLWVPVTPPFLAFILSADSVRLYLLSVEKRQRALLMRMFESHVSKDIAKAIWAQRDQFLQQGLPRPQELIATVLFTDLRGFTTISEQLADPGKLMEWLNEYMEAMTTQVLRHGGIVNKYIGDAIMAVFGVPVARQSEDQISEDAVNAIRCALAMGEQLEKLNEKWEAEDRPTVKMRVGIFTGPLVVGCVGSKQRREYTVIGDTVNVAARLEGVRKELDLEMTCRILIGESTLKYSNGQFRIKELGSIKLKGKYHSHEVFQVVGNRDDAEEHIGEFVYESSN